MTFFGFGQSADIEIHLDGMENRKMAEIKSEDGKKDRYFLYYDGESVSGKVTVSLKKPGSRLEHQGVKIEFVGQIELYYDRGNHHEFTSLVKELARPGELMHNSSFDFEFNQVEKPYESYSGTNVRLRYHLKDVIVGKIYFLLVRIKIKHMEIAIIKRETTGSGPNTFNENENIAKYEIMDGAPVRGESIPIRVFLAGYDLAPTMRDINKKFSVRYYLNLVLVDEEERRYFKQQEITLWRKGERIRRPIQQQLLAQQYAMQQLSVNSHPEKQLENAKENVVKRQELSEPVDDEMESPTLPTGAEQPPSPQQSQSPMQEEIPKLPAPENPPKRIPQQYHQNILADSPPPLPSQDLDGRCSPQLPTPPEEPPTSIESPEEEFVEALSPEENQPDSILPTTENTRATNRQKELEVAQ